jgi:hypothetical protein
MLRKLAMSIVGLVLGLTMLFIAIGAFSSSAYVGTKTIQLDAPPARVWQEITDLESLPKRRREVVSVEILETRGGVPWKWKERTDMGGHVVFEKVEEVPNKKLLLRMTESTFGMTGTWMYELEGNEMTRLTITEDSVIKSIPVRAVMTLAGRDGNLEKEASIIVRSLQK